MALYTKAFSVLSIEILEVQICLENNLETGARQRCCWEVTWKLVLGTGLLVYLSLNLGQVL